ncbi:MAG: BtpA/SgcQ family protein [Pseudomonadota bacterium]|nr:BtpA/SgcQ family protein [Pseudomonadota bacterium]
MKKRFNKVFGGAKPVIAMVHLGALPGSPLFNSKTGIDGLINNARADLEALQSAGVDAVMFGNENDRPYELKVDIASTATAAYIIGELKSSITVPFGVNMLWDPMSSIALGVATGAQFVREIFSGVYASDMGQWSPDAGKAMRYRDKLNRPDMLMLYNISAEFAYSLDQRSLPDRAKSTVFSSVPDAVLVSGQITGEAAALSDLEAVKAVLPDTPVLANTGVTHETLHDVFSIVDGCIVGSSLKFNGDTWQPVDRQRARKFMEIAKNARSK